MSLCGITADLISGQLQREKEHALVGLEHPGADKRFGSSSSRDGLCSSSTAAMDLQTRSRSNTAAGRQQSTSDQVHHYQVSC